MKRLITLVLLTFIVGILFTANEVKATHMMGGDVSWTCKGDSSFTITITGYRDCNGIPITGADISLVPTGGGKCSGSTITLSGNMANGTDVTPVCQKSCDRCTSGSCTFPFGVQQWQEIVTEHFPKNSCCKYEIQWQECCRNGALTTINPDNFYINAVLDRCDTPCDNSPYFTNPPIGIICTGQCFTFNQGVEDNNIDAQGNADSLVYKLIEPLNGEGQPVSWNSPYNYKEPLKYNGAFGNPNGKWDPAHKICDGFHLDSLTGDLYFEPMKADVTVIAIEVEAWKKNALGQPYLADWTQRDVQFAIIQCPADYAPTLTGVNGTTKYSIDYCVDQYQCFNIISYDQTAADSVTVSWNAALASLGATFTANNGATKHPIGKFCWKPTQARSYPYYFVANAVNNACPVNNRTSESYAITVHPKPEANYSAVVDNCGNVTFDASAVVGKGIPGIASYTWVGAGTPPIYSTAQSFTHKYRKWGTYPYTLTIVANPPPTPACQFTYNDSVVIPKSVEISLPTEDTTVCKGTIMKINSTTTLGNAPYKYRWNCSSSTSASITDTFSQDTSVVVYVTDANGCTNYDSMKVHVTIPPSPILPADTFLCADSPQSSIPMNDRITAAATHVWQVQSGGSWKQISVATDNSAAALPDSGYYRVTVSDSGVANCSGTAYVHVRLNPIVTVNPDSTVACFGDNVTIKAGDGDSLHTTWTWYDLTHGKPLSYTTRYITVKPGSNGIFYQVTATQKENGITCIATGDKRVVSVPKPVIQFKPVPAQCINGSPVDLDFYASPAGIANSWSSSDASASRALSGSEFYPSVAGQNPAGKPFELRYTVESQFGCVSSDSTTVEVDTLPKIVVMPNDTTCSSVTSIPLTAVPAGGKWTGYKVEETSASSGSYNFYPSQAGQGTYTLKYTYVQPTGGKCEATDSMVMRVYQEPTVSITPINPICQGASNVQLSGNPAIGGIWSSPDLPSGSLNTTTGVINPSLVAVGTYKIYYSYGYAGGPSGQAGYYCNQVDSSTLTVNATPFINIITPDNTTYCISSGLHLLDATPAGGHWTGTGMYGNYFDPSTAYKSGAGPYTETYTYTDPVTGCSASSPISLYVDDTASLKVIAPSTMCQGQPLTLGADTSNASGIRWRRVDGTPWVGGDSTAATTTFTENANDDLLQYVLLEAVALNRAGNICPAPVQIFKVEIGNVSPSFVVTPKDGCAPLTVRINADSSASVDTFIWNFGDGTIVRNTTGAPNPHTYDTAKTYNITLTGISNAGCKVTTQPKVITVYPSPVPVIEANPNPTSITLPTVKFDGSSSLNYTSSSIFTWDFGDSSKPSSEITPEHTYANTDTFDVTLKIKNINGCVGEASKKEIILPQILVFIPNAFTPNGVGPKKDQVFNVVASGFTSYDMKIYNRWGELLYETEDITKGWDGTFHGQYCQDDAYVYVVKISASTGRQYTYTGSVTLLR